MILPSARGARHCLRTGPEPNGRVDAEHLLQEPGADAARLMPTTARGLTRPMNANIRGLTAPGHTARVGVRCRAPVARQAHNLEVGSSTLPTATGRLAPFITPAWFNTGGFRVTRSLVHRIIKITSVAS